MSRFFVGLCVTVAVALYATAGVVAARQPTRAEREAITNALPRSVRALPVGCVWLNIRVSKSPSYAYVAPEIMNAVPPDTRCLRYASNGFYILKRSTGGNWSIVFQGSDWPSCSRHIPRDLVPCTK